MNITARITVERYNGEIEIKETAEFLNDLAEQDTIVAEIAEVTARAYERAAAAVKGRR